jgi:serine/threonine protein kinase
MTEDRLDSLLLAWQEEHSRGRDMPAAELCRDCPELQAELDARIRKLRHMNALLFTAERREPAKIAAGSNETAASADSVSAAACEFTPVPVLPGYELLGELGRGGMGVVYKARHVGLDRFVALKVLRMGGASATSFERLRGEARAVARLQHPHIVQVHDVGEYHGLPYLVLEFCAGGSLRDRLQAGPLPPARAAEVVEALARAVHAAHQKQVLHRDLKPGNVLLTDDGTPKVTDFGLAKRLDLAAGPTLSGTVLGTPAYMPPEQARGQTDRVGPAADVYALGAILYECLSGRPPFQADTTADTLLQVLSQDPPSLRQLRPEVPEALQAVCLKCLQKEPSQRYATAEDLARELRSFVRDGTGRARDERTLLSAPADEQGRSRGPRRRRVRHLILGAGAVLVLLVGLGLFWHLRQPEPVPTDTPAVQARPEKRLPQPESRQRVAPRPVPPGWKEIRSRVGRFVVWMPGLPKETTSTVQSKGGPVEQHTYFLRETDRLGSYAVVYAEYPGLTFGQGDRALDAARDGGLAPIKARLTGEKKIKLGTFPGREIDADLPGQRGLRLRFRLYLVEQRLYQLLAIGGAEFCAGPDVQQFLDSFRLIPTEETAQGERQPLKK